MASENTLSKADVCTDFRTCVLDLEKDVLHMGLYRAHPYFTDVLEWLEGKILPGLKVLEIKN